mgnify:CR=1 FL=1
MTATIIIPERLIKGKSPQELAKYLKFVAQMLKLAGIDVITWESENGTDIHGKRSTQVTA